MNNNNFINTRIKNKIDTFSNWKTNNPVLLAGEIAIVKDNDNILIKIGDGTSKFNDLDFINSISLSSDSIFSKNLNADIVELGTQSKAIEDDEHAFVWNGIALETSSDSYTSHGEGTFSINPSNGLSGIYVGEKNLAESFSKVTYRKWISSDINI